VTGYDDGYVGGNFAVIAVDETSTLINPMAKEL
jgi:hypothetical protein